MTFPRIKFNFSILCVLLIALVNFPSDVKCAKKGSAPVTQPSPAPVVEQEPVIEEVTQKQLERILQEKDYVAVYWCKCARCAKKILGENLFSSFNRHSVNVCVCV